MDLLIVGNDKIGRKLLSNLQKNTGIMILYDNSTTLMRVLGLIIRGSLPIGLAIKIAFAEFMRQEYQAQCQPAITTNADILRIISENPVKNIYLFRAGLIINKEVLETGVNVFNVHCATLPEYRGIGSIARAIKEKAYEQNATLYRVTKRIDYGEIIDVYPYRLNNSLSYMKNEDAAYAAGINLLLKTLGKEQQFG